MSMYNQEQDSRWAEGQTNANSERPDDLDGAAEGENETASISALPSQNAPVSRPMSRGSYYGRERDRGEPGDYHHGGSRRHRPHGGGESSMNISASGRSRNDSYRDPGRYGNGGYGYDPYYPSRQPAYGYGAPYYMGGFAPGPYGAPPAGTRERATREMLERFRVEDPVRYRQWYDQYQAYRRNPQQVPCPEMPVFPAPHMGPAFPAMGPAGWPPHGAPYPASKSSSVYNEPLQDRGPHSGRSSVNEELIGYNYNSMYPTNHGQNSTLTHDVGNGFKPLQNDSRFIESPEQEPERKTPLQFSSTHSIGVLTPLGQLIRLKQGTTLEIIPIKSLVNHLPEFREVDSFPGPLIKELTHKNKVISFCQKKIKAAKSSENQVDRDHYILLWELLILLLRQNGNVVGSDIAELLIGNKNNASRSAEDIISDDGDNEEPVENSDDVTTSEEATAPRSVTEAKATEKFCQLLMYGHKMDALEYAMSNGLWGHALFLATKMDERTYGNVMARFANCIAYNHPLQTFYQLLSGKQPASANSCCDETFGDWKPHLAMILSNAGSRPEVEEKSLNRMGDTLASKGLVYAAQFCYLMGKEEFRSDSKLGSLLGYCKAKKNVIEATQMTEVYEFALSLADPHFTLGLDFIQSKLEYTKTLVSLGFVEQAYRYCEEMEKKLKHCIHRQSGVDVVVLKKSILQISERLVNIEESNNGIEPKWVQDLRTELSAPAKLERLESVSDSVASERRESNADERTLGNEPYKPSETDQAFEHGHGNDGYNFEPSNSMQGGDLSGGVPLHQQSNFQDTQSISVQPPMFVPSQSGITQDNSLGFVHGETLSSMPPNFSSANIDNNTWAAGPQISNGSHFNQANSFMQQPGSGSFPDNNNYIPRNDFSGYGQLNSMYDGQVDTNSGASNKKKSVRFEEGEEPDGSTIEDETESEEIGGNRENSSVIDSDIMQPRLRKNRMQTDTNNATRDSFVRKHDGKARFEAIGAAETSKIARETTSSTCIKSLSKSLSDRNIARNSFTDDLNSVPEHETFTGVRNLAFNNTFPIDEPLCFQNQDFQKRPSLNIGQSKTFPIDKHCCSTNRLCRDHVDFYSNGSKYGSLESLPTYSSSTIKPNGIGRQFDTINQSETDIRSKINDFNQSKHSSAGQPQRHQPDQRKDDKENKKVKSGGGGDGKQQKSGWFGGLMNKIIPKAPNQMILPDDKEPTIVWDPQLKKWVNTKEEEDGDSGPKGPPPTDFDLTKTAPPSGMAPPMMMQQPLQPNGQPGQMPSMYGSYSNPMMQAPISMAPGIPSQAVQNPQNVPLQRLDNFNVTDLNQASFSNNQQVLQGNVPNLPNGNQNGPVPNGSAGGNKYKLPKNRNVRSGYIDILNPGATNPNRLAGNPPDGGVVGAMNTSQGPLIPNMFIPSPAAGSGDSGPVSFLTPAPEGGPPIATAQNQSETN